MPTRSTHKVRIKNPHDKTIYVDVEVIDLVVLVKAKGTVYDYTGNQGNTEEYIIDVTAKTNSHPLVIDNTGDGANIEDPPNTDPKTQTEYTRSCHMVRHQSATDSTQMLDIEVLDAISFVLPNKAEMSLMMPPPGIRETVVDNTGNGLTVDSSFDTTRSTHIQEIQQLTDGTVSDTDAPYTGRLADPIPNKFLLNKKVDAISFTGPNKGEWLMFIPQSTINDIDTTRYVTDPETGKPIPPDNTDPDPYVRWPKDSKGPWLGKDPSAVLNPGPLWWVCGSSAPSGPWYWWIPVQQPYEWSQDTVITPEPSNHYAEAVWVSRRLPNIGSDYGMWNESTTTGPAAPLAPFGYTSLENAILISQDPNPTFAQAEELAIDGPGWGVLSFKVSYPKCVPGEKGTPDIWDLTGIANPKQIPPPPGSPSDTPPTDAKVPPALAASVAYQYGLMWQETSDWCNSDQRAIDGTERVQYEDYIYYQIPGDGTSALVRPINFPYPRTAFANIPLGFPVSAPKFGIDNGTFIGGIPAGYWFSHGELWIFQPAYATYQNTGQLNPARWDTTNPENPVYIGPRDRYGNPIPLS